MRRRTLLAGLCGAGVWRRSARSEPAYPLFYADAAPFRAAVAAAKDPPFRQRITGLTVPHHLLAADLIAQAFRLASAGKYRRLIVLSPDHFKRSSKPFATTARSFATPLGRVPTDTPAVAALLRNCPLAGESPLFSHEHGIHAVLPFAAHYCRSVPVVAVACGIRTTPDEWRSLAEALLPLLDDDTLVVQSTDFSHYLPAGAAAHRDAETLRVLTAADPSGITGLSQPDHIDSKAAMWLQMTLQQRRFQAAATVVQNRNAIHYGGPPDCPETTSYITLLWSPEPLPTQAMPGDAVFFAGDTHFGRFVAGKLEDPVAAAGIESSIRAVTAGRPLILNLEGVMLDEMPERPAGKWEIRMDGALSLTWLKRLGTTAVILANNHSGDGGPAAREAMARRLAAAGIRTASHGDVLEFPGFRLAAATDIDNTPQPRGNFITQELVQSWKKPGEPRPLFAFLHAGKEYDAATTARQRLLAGWAESAGASLITGCHPHRPSPGWERTDKSLRFPSLGNFLFDQLDPKNSGGLLEVRFFAQGTWCAAWHPLGNLYAGTAGDSGREKITLPACR